MQSLSLTARTGQLGRHAAAFLGFSIPISVALDNTLLVLVAVLWLASGDLKRKLAIVAANPVALAALALFGILVAGLFYGARHPGDGLGYLGKYDDLLFIPIFITLFQDARMRELALRWFCAAMILTFVVADVTALGLLEGNPWLLRPLGYAGAFKASITHGLLAAFAAFLFALLALREARWPQRALFAVLALVAFKNVAFIAISRTAYLVLALLALYLSFILFRKRGLVIVCLILGALFAAAYSVSGVFRERVDTVVFESGDWQARWPSRESVTLRLEWYQRSLDIVREHPLLGSGTGSFPRAFAEAVKDAKAAHVANPHNEYLLIAVQAGLVGLALLLYLFVRQLMLAQHLASPLETHLAYGLVITMAVGCLFNSFLLDHTEGLLYAWLTGVLYGGLRPQDAK
jgi:O-antigen ligase